MLIAIYFLCPICFRLSDKDMYFYILSQCQFQHDHDYKYHYWILFINGISQLFFFATQTFPRRNPWRRRQSPSQRGRKCEPWKVSVVPCFQFSLEEKFLIFPQKPGDRKPLSAHVDSILVAAPLSVHLCDHHLSGSTTNFGSGNLQDHHLLPKTCNCIFCIIPSVESA